MRNEKWLKLCLDKIDSRMAKKWLEFIIPAKNGTIRLLPYDWYDQGTECIKFHQKKEFVEISNVTSPIKGYQFAEFSDDS